MNDQEQDERSARAGMRLVFWTWTAIIAGGLVSMIALPLGGR